MSFSRVTNNLAQIAIVVIAALGAIIVYGAASANTIYWPMMAVGATLLVIPLGYTWYQTRSYQRDSISLWQAEVERLKTTGIKVAVDLTQATVKSAKWFTQEERYQNHDILLMNALGGNPELNMETVEHHASRILLEVEKNGEKIKVVSPGISKDILTLTMLIEHQGKTNIYFDQDNPDVYWLDLDFLSE